jgi:hypothetical protein
MRTARLRLVEPVVLRVPDSISVFNYRKAADACIQEALGKCSPWNPAPCCHSQLTINFLSTAACAPLESSALAPAGGVAATDRPPRGGRPSGRYAVECCRRAAPRVNRARNGFARSGLDVSPHASGRLSTTSALAGHLHRDEVSYAIRCARPMAAQCARKRATEAVRTACAESRVASHG